MESELAPRSKAVGASRGENPSVEIHGDLGALDHRRFELAAPVKERFRLAS